jgi:alkanesulfonate monooxygenase SsuD/methylene tetrahydromethanopterin reductase-like flavin-dependent oxidoreductase (luciferase family)
MTTDGAIGIQYGVILPGGSADEQLEAAVLAEQSGWDGVFVWEAGYGVDPWGLLSAIAVRTERIRLGTMLTPLPWRRPWKVASQVATLDQLSGGRAILTVGLGAQGDGLPDTGEVTGARERAALLDEGIDLIRGLWRGDSRYEGQHFRYRCEPGDLVQAVRPVQENIPIWVAAAWPRPKSMRRVLRCDGVVPEYHPAGKVGAPEDVRDLRAWLAENGARPGLDIVTEGETPVDDAKTAAAVVAPWAEAGCTWWLESRWGSLQTLAERLEQTRERIAIGPPRA